MATAEARIAGTERRLSLSRGDVITSFPLLNGQIIKTEVDGTTRRMVEFAYDPRYAVNWIVGQKRGLSVPPELYATQGDSSLLIPDLTEHGAVLIDSHVAGLHSADPNSKEIGISQAMELFIEQMGNPKGRKDIGVLVHNYMLEATERGIQLPPKTPLSLLVYPSGHISPVTLKLSDTVMHSREQMTTEFARRRVDENNRLGETWFLTTLGRFGSNKLKTAA